MTKNNKLFANKNIYRVAIYLPIEREQEYGPAGTIDSLEELKNKTLDEINRAKIHLTYTLQSIEEVPEHQIYDISVQSLNGKLQKFEPTYNKRTKKTAYLKFETSFDLTQHIELGFKLDWYKNYTDEDKARQLLAYDCQSLFDTISLFFVAVQLAKPGCFFAEEGFVFINGEFFRNTPAIDHWLNPNLYEENWPIIQELRIKETWHWVSRQKGFFHGLSENKIGRSLNAFTYLFSNGRSFGLADEFFWCMAGLEAIYTDGHENVMNQFIEKSSLLLGESVNFQKKVKTMYGYRSRLLHGQKNIPTKFRKDPELGEEISKYEQEFWDVCVLARKMLLATLQQLIKNDSDDIQFEYKMSIIKSCATPRGV
jgi:hypothetical protein